MLKGIPKKIISPELMKIMMEMGHGDELVIADGNFPSASHAQRLVRADGHDVPELLEAILALYPLDPYVEKPVTLMAVVDGDATVPTIWDTYTQKIKEQGYKDGLTENIDRFDFYDRAKKSLCSCCNR